jgi:hypothetical protein
MVAVYFITAAAVTIPYLRWRKGAGVRTSPHGHYLAS